MTGKVSYDRSRWLVLSLLMGFSTISYVERINLSVAGRFIRDQLGVSDQSIGWMFSAFLIGYTLAQLPSGYLADRYGPHRVLTCAAMAWFAITVAIAGVVGILGAAGVGAAVACLVILRFALGVAEAPTYPAATRAVATCFPAREHARANAMVQCASFAGSALTLPLMALCITRWGWQSAMLFTALPALVLGFLWWRLARAPLLIGARQPEKAPVTGKALDGEMPNREFDWRNVSILAGSYFFHGYLGYLFFFWFYTYLVDARGFSIVASGWIAALPTAAAAIAALAGGWVSDRSTCHSGWLRGRRALLLWAAFAGAAALIVGAYAEATWLAVGGFIVAIATRGFVEATYWTLAIELGGARSGTAAGLMNAMGNVGGALSTAAAPILVHSLGWAWAFAIAAVATAVSGLIIIALNPGPQGSRRPAALNNGKPA